MELTPLVGYIGFYHETRFLRCFWPASWVERSLWRALISRTPSARSTLGVSRQNLVKSERPAKESNCGSWSPKLRYALRIPKGREAPRLALGHTCPDNVQIGCNLLRGSLAATAVCVRFDVSSVKRMTGSSTNLRVGSRTPALSWIPEAGRLVSSCRESSLNISMHRQSFRPVGRIPRRSLRYTGPACHDCLRAILAVNGVHSMNVCVFTIALAEDYRGSLAVRQVQSYYYTEPKTKTRYLSADSRDAHQSGGTKSHGR
jgi:hypothetical protein